MTDDTAGALLRAAPPPRLEPDAISATEDGVIGTRLWRPAPLTPPGRTCLPRLRSTPPMTHDTTQTPPARPQIRPAAGSPDAGALAPSGGLQEPDTAR
jgi:hypothetical protein